MAGWDRPDTVSTQTKVHLEPLLRGTGLPNMICQSLACWEPWGTTSDSFDSCLGCCLEHTEQAIIALTKSLHWESKKFMQGFPYDVKIKLKWIFWPAQYFSGNLAFLAICHPPRYCHGSFFYAPSLPHLLKGHPFCQTPQHLPLDSFSQRFHLLASQPVLSPALTPWSTATFTLLALQNSTWMSPIYPVCPSYLPAMNCQSSGHPHILL